jgi:hypothetical protein
MENHIRVITGARPSPSGNKGTDLAGPSYPGNRGRTGGLDRLIQVTEEQLGLGLSYSGTVTEEELEGSTIISR